MVDHTLEKANSCPPGLISLILLTFLNFPIFLTKLSTKLGCEKTTIKKYLRQFNIKKGGHTTHRKNISYGQKFYFDYDQDFLNPF